jgi:hypothetical protein
MLKETAVDYALWCMTACPRWSAMIYSKRSQCKHAKKPYQAANWPACEKGLRGRGEARKKAALIGKSERNTPGAGHAA